MRKKLNKLTQLKNWRTKEEEDDVSTWMVKKKQDEGVKNWRLKKMKIEEDDG